MRTTCGLRLPRTRFALNVVTRAGSADIPLPRCAVGSLLGCLHYLRLVRARCGGRRFVSWTTALDLPAPRWRCDLALPTTLMDVGPHHTPPTPIYTPTPLRTPTVLLQHDVYANTHFGFPATGYVYLHTTCHPVRLRMLWHMVRNLPFRGTDGATRAVVLPVTTHPTYFTQFARFAHTPFTTPPYVLWCLLTFHSAARAAA